MGRRGDSGLDRSWPDLGACLSFRCGTAPMLYHRPEPVPGRTSDTVRPVQQRPLVEPVDRSAKRLDIQGLRAVAVIAVILQHAGVPGMPGGFVGVDVFLVVSGYVITLSLLRQLQRREAGTIRSFYARRIRRILPAASLSIVATVVLTACFLPRLGGSPSHTTR